MLEQADWEAQSRWAYQGLIHAIVNRILSKQNLQTNAQWTNRSIQSLLKLILRQLALFQLFLGIPVNAKVAVTAMLGY